jgi:molecular chaperone GrpE
MEEEKKDKHKKEMEECRKQRDEYLAGWQRARADLLNYKKEETERMGQIIKYAAEELIMKILPIIDNLERAEKGMSNDLKENSYFKGFLQIKGQIKDLLKEFEVEEIDALGKKFDPNFHEVVEEINEGDPGEIKEIIQKGYTIQNKIIRPVKVKIVKL